MRNFITYILIAALLVYAGRNLYIQQLVWRHLPAAQQEAIFGFGLLGQVSTVATAKEQHNITDPTFRGKQVYKVSFLSKKQPVRGPVVVLADTATKKVVGASTPE